MDLSVADQATIRGSDQAAEVMAALAAQMQAARARRRQCEDGYSRAE
jgi:hypothetical protein